MDWGANGGDPLQNVWNTLQQGVQAIQDLNQTVARAFPQSQGTTTSASAGGASALPGAPAGYLTITLPNGQPAKIPYYNV